MFTAFAALLVTGLVAGGVSIGICYSVSAINNATIYTPEHTFEDLITEITEEKES